jgi:hypothetical protein
MLYVQYIHLTKAKRIRKRQTSPPIREDEDYDCKGSDARKKIKETLVMILRGAWCQEELISGKLPVIK